ncbi:MAG TPA: peptidoglycan-binding domain-containing protein [Polyangiaceae bacterium]|nr:peptidoglycan-binding domain-containing protein [Polyangiaceae bacterium]
MISLSFARRSRGPDVRRWQLFLEQQGLFNDQVDGIFDVATDVATRQFQQLHQLAVDGVVGTNSYTAAQKLGMVVYRRMTDGEVSSNARREAKAILDAHWREPLGSEFPFDDGGRSIIARLEQHYHEPGGVARPWGYHTGVSLFVATTIDSNNPIQDP